MRQRNDGHKSTIVVLSSTILLLFLIALSASAVTPHEQGLSFIQNFNLEQTGGASQNFGVVQDDDGLIYVANLMNVLEYDGIRWRSIRHSAGKRVISIDRSDDGTIYLGFQGDLGRLVRDDKGRAHIMSLRSFLPDSLREVGFIWTTLVTPEGVYFRSPNRLYRWKPDKVGLGGQMDLIALPGDGILLGLSRAHGTTYIWQDGEGLLAIAGNKALMVPGGDFVAGTRIRMVSPYKDNTLLLACEDNGVCIYNGQNIVPFKSEISVLGSELFALTISALPNDLFALTTRYGGLLLFDVKGDVQRIIDQSMGLQDNNILGLPSIDVQGGLWLPLNYGLARVEALSPLDVYSHQLGLEGSIPTIIRHKGTLYAGGSQGVFALKPSEEPGETATLERIQGVDAQCWQLSTVGEQLLAITSAGLYEVLNSKSARLIERIRLGYCLSLSADSTRLYVGTYDSGLYLFEKRAGTWRSSGKVEGTARQILKIQPRQNGDLWLMTNYKSIQRVHAISDSNMDLLNPVVTTYDTSDGLPSLRYFSPFIIDDEFYVGSPEGLFTYNSELDGFEVSSLLGESFTTGQRGLWNIAVDKMGSLWFNSQFAKGARVSQLEDGSYDLTYPLLRTSESNYLTFYPEDDGNVVWAGTEDSKMIRYDEAMSLEDTSSFTTLIRRVIVNGDSVLLDGGAVSRSGEVKLDHSLNTLRFEYTLPRYDAPEAKKFQYRLIGLSEEWSSWTNEVYHDFTNLSKGRYRFEVKGYDIYYIESEVGVFDFQIMPSWYESVWAFLFYILAFIAIMQTIIKWRLHQVEIKNHQLEELVRQRTLELASANSQISEYNEKLEETLQRRTRELVLSERQAAFGQFVQGIVHNLRNPLVSSTLSAEMLEMAFDRSSKQEHESKDVELEFLRGLSDTVASSVGRIKKANQKLSDMITSLLTKSRSDKIEKTQAIDLNNVVKMELDFLEADVVFKHKVEKVIEFSNQALPVYVVPGELAQVIQNLTRNSLDALYNVEKPKIIIRVEKIGDRAVLTVKDNGPGISDEIIDRIFDPFFTTKPSQGDHNIKSSEPRGTGLGLWMCRETVQSFDGTIEVDSKPGHGTSFIVILPQTTRAIQATSDHFND